LERFRAHSDVDSDLTDGASSVVMEARGLSEALTDDDHARQAGSRALLLEGVREAPRRGRQSARMEDRWGLPLRLERLERLERRSAPSQGHITHGITHAGAGERFGGAPPR
jgi:hypothetical protein